LLVVATTRKHSQTPSLARLTNWKASAPPLSERLCESDREIGPDGVANVNVCPFLVQARDASWMACVVVTGRVWCGKDGTATPQRRMLRVRLRTLPGGIKRRNVRPARFARMYVIPVDHDSSSLPYACADCGHLQDSMSRVCDACGSVRVVLGTLGGVDVRTAVLGARASEGDGPPVAVGFGGLRARLLARIGEVEAELARLRGLPHAAERAVRQACEESQRTLDVLRSVLGPDEARPALVEHAESEPIAVGFGPSPTEVALARGLLAIERAYENGTEYDDAAVEGVRLALETLAADAKRRRDGRVKMCEAALLTVDAAQAFFERGDFTAGCVLTARAAEAYCEGGRLLGLGGEP
jgi:hypothetical protein